MKKSVLRVFAALVVAVSPSAFAQGNADAGETKVAVCGGCHGADGNSLVPNFPKLAGLGEKYLIKQMDDIKSGKRPVPEMTGQLDNLSDQDIADIAAYYAAKSIQLSGSKEAQVLLNSGEQGDSLTIGEAIYRYGNKASGVPACSGCHSPTGQGNAPAGYPRLGGQFPEYVAKQLQAFRAGERTNDDSSVMRQVAQRMSDAEVQAVSNYIAGLYQGE